MAIEWTNSRHGSGCRATVGPGGPAASGPTRCRAQRANADNQAAAPMNRTLRYRCPTAHGAPHWGLTWDRRR